MARVRCNPSCCWPICSLLLKLERGHVSRTSRVSGETQKAENNSTTSQVVLRARGFVARLLSEQGLIAGDDAVQTETAEVRVLVALQWRLDPPTALSWLTAFCGRFDTATRGYFQTSTLWILSAATSAAVLFTEHVDYLELPPRPLASFLFCLGLVGASLLPPRVLCTSGFEVEEVRSCASLLYVCGPEVDSIAQLGHIMRAHLSASLLLDPADLNWLAFSAHLRWLYAGRATAAED